MRLRTVRHLTDTVLVLEARELSANDRGNNAQLLIHLGEIDRRKLYLAAGYPSLYQYCIGELLMSEDVAYKRMRVARTARRYPRILPAIADGRLNLNSVLLLTRHLTPANADDLLSAAEGQRRSAIELLIARRFPQPDLPNVIAASPQLAARPVETLCATPSQTTADPPPPPAIATSDESEPRPRITPLAVERFGFQTSISQRIHDKLREAQELLSHEIAPGDLESLLESLLDLSLPQLRKRKHAATDQPREQKASSSANARYIPNAVKQVVWERDKGQCTFVSESGHRCEARTQIEFDHILPVARGGSATVANTRLRCRPHNQFEAEKIFGFEFMKAKREAASSA